MTEKSPGGSRSRPLWNDSFLILSPSQAYIASQWGNRCHRASETRSEGRPAQDSRRTFKSNLGVPSCGEDHAGFAIELCLGRWICYVLRLFSVPGRAISLVLGYGYR